MKRNRLSAVGLSLLLGASLLSQVANAQGLWKYTDKDGKVTYSDKPPKPGEKAEQVKSDPNANIIESIKTRQSGEGARNSTTIDERIAKRNQLRQELRDKVDAAREALENARAQLEAGLEPLPEEVTVVVGRTSKGAPTGANQVIRKPEYYERVKKLETAVADAEKKLAESEREYARNAP